jgi:hypothetical protein
MPTPEETAINTRIAQMRTLTDSEQGAQEFYEAANLALAVIHDTVGGSHPLSSTLEDALNKSDWNRAVAAARSVIKLHEQGALKSPRLQIAHEIEGDLLDIAQAQVAASEKQADPTQKQTRLAIAAFLAGAALEDALRRLCDSRGFAYDAQHSSVSKLQAVLYQPSKQIEVISSSENKHITVWGDTRNKADHGKFGDITFTEVVTMIPGVRAFLDKHLP